MKHKHTHVYGNWDSVCVICQQIDSYKSWKQDVNLDWGNFTTAVVVPGYITDNGRRIFINAKRIAEYYCLADDWETAETLKEARQMIINEQHIYRPPKNMDITLYKLSGIIAVKK